MALVRVTALLDFRASTSALSTQNVSTGYNVGAATTGQQLYAGLHLTAVSLGASSTGKILQMTIQSASSSGFSPLTTQASFTLSTSPGAQWATPVGSLSTAQIWWRANWMSTDSSTGGAWRGLVWMGLK